MVFSAARAEQGSSQAELGPLQRPAGRAGPGAGGAIEVAVTADARLAFVSLEGIAQIAVFSLQHALTRGFGPADYIGSIPAGLAPVGLAVSPDGRWLYATSEVARGGTPGAGREGSLSVTSVRRAATNPRARGGVHGDGRVRAGPGDHLGGRPRGVGHRPGQQCAARVRRGPAAHRPGPRAAGPGPGGHGPGRG